MTIAVFLHGTAIMHKNAAGLSRERIVRQVIEQEESVRDFANYIPIGNAAAKLQQWVSQGAEIYYLSALTENKKARGDELVGREGLKSDALVLERYGFPEGAIYHRGPGEEYKDIAEKLAPDILIEDDCESIGGEAEMVYPRVRPEIKPQRKAVRPTTERQRRRTVKIKSIVVKEFGGIDHLPDDVSRLLSY